MGVPFLLGYALLLVACTTAHSQKNVSLTKRSASLRTLQLSVQPSYSVMAADANKCIIGFEHMTLYQCTLYADSIGFEEFTDEDDNYCVTNKSSPKGCHLNHLNSVYFNKDPIGGSDPNMSPVCIRPEIYSVMAVNTNECTIGSQMTYAQCEAYAASIDMLSFMEYYKNYYADDDPDYYQYTRYNRDDRPKGCVHNSDPNEEYGVHFNEHNTGSSDFDNSPVCIMTPSNGEASGDVLTEEKSPDVKVSAPQETSDSTEVCSVLSYATTAILTCIAIVYSTL